MRTVSVGHRAIACLGALALTVTLAACGSGQHPYDATADNNGYYIRLGNISYQLQISRELNQYSVEDHQYLVGLPAGEKPPSPTQFWYGVFLWAINDAKQPGTTPANAASDFDIVDTEGNHYYPVALNPSINQWAWTQQTLAPHVTEPGADTTAASGPTGGALILFKLSTAVYANRPLTLEIHAPGVSRVGTISLDL